MLTLTLKELQRDGLITRTVYPIIPPRVEYELTNFGNSLLKPIRQLGDWARQIAKEFTARGTNTTHRSPKMCKAFADPRAIAPVRGG